MEALEEFRWKCFKIWVDANSNQLAYYHNQEVVFILPAIEKMLRAQVH